MNEYNNFQPRPLRIIVTGCRDWNDREAIVCSTVFEALGADGLAADVAKQRGWLVERHYADWGNYGKSAGPRRNAEMVKSGADLCLAFWDGKSRGTLDCMSQCVAAGIPVRITARKAQ
jgi:hypothetical protein